jgi:hypothetical protein
MTVPSSFLNIPSSLSSRMMATFYHQMIIQMIILLSSSHVDNKEHYHRCQHTSKTMGIAVVVMAFDETLNNGETAFPCMSRRYSHESRSLHGTRVLKEDEIIWESAVKVWNDLPSQR